MWPHTAANQWHACTCWYALAQRQRGPAHPRQHGEPSGAAPSRLGLLPNCHGGGHPPPPPPA